MFIHKTTRTGMLALTTLTLAITIVVPRTAQAGPLPDLLNPDLSNQVIPDLSNQVIYFNPLPDLSNRVIYFNINRAYDVNGLPDGSLAIEKVNTASGELEGQLSIKKEPSRRAMGRIILEGSSGPYGPATCLPGYVWRGAVPNDLVCVTPQTRDQAHYDNSQDFVRKLVLPGGFFLATPCLQGYVWREAVPSDLVCVTPQTRDQAHYDNSQAAKRRLGTLRITFATTGQIFVDPVRGYSFAGELRGLGVSKGLQAWGVNGSYTFNRSKPFPFEGSTISTPLK